MAPIVSVIVPAYNRAMTIDGCIRSVLEQTFPDFEIVVVDDGSTDETREKVRGIRDKRLRLVCHDGNLGAAAARNTGMKAATGEYIAWLDSDDEWLPEKLNIQLEALEQAEPDQRACYTAYERIEKGKSRTYVPKYVTYRELFLGCDQAPGSSLLFERTLLDEIGYLDTNLRRYEDWDWLLRYCSAFRLLAVDAPLVRVYFSAERSAEFLEASALAFVSKYSEQLRQFRMYRNVVISRRWMEVASYYAREHDFRKVIQYLLKGILTYPFQPPAVWAWLVNNWLGIKIGSAYGKGAFVIGSKNE